jgi:hypothetical protein
MIIGALPKVIVPGSFIARRNGSSENGVDRGATRGPRWRANGN